MFWNEWKINFQVFIFWVVNGFVHNFQVFSIDQKWNKKYLKRCTKTRHTSEPRHTVWITLVYTTALRAPGMNAADNGIRAYNLRKITRNSISVRYNWIDLRIYSNLNWWKGGVSEKNITFLFVHQIICNFGIICIIWLGIECSWFFVRWVVYFSRY